jgi:hypothetical protein
MTSHSSAISDIQSLQLAASLNKILHFIPAIFQFLQNPDCYQEKDELLCTYDRQTNGTTVHRYRQFEHKSVIYYSNFFRQQMHFLLKYKMLQLTFKIPLCGLLHVLVRLDHHQGAYAEPC